MSTVAFLNDSWQLLVTRVLPFLFILTIVVFFHELGHFLVARWCRVAVSTFSVGFGPELVGFTDRRGTRWKLSAIPLGGYVMFLGDENAASEADPEALAKLTPEQRRNAYASKPVWQRAAIIAAGPLANFILALVILATIFTLFGRAEITPRVDSTIPGSAAEAAGLQVGDLIVAIDGQPIATFNDMQRIVGVSADKRLTLTIDRRGERIDLVAVPKWSEVNDPFGNKVRTGLLGVNRTPGAGDIVQQRFSPPAAIAKAAGEIVYIVQRTVTYIAGVFTGRESADQVGGLIQVAQISGQVAALGFVPLLNLAAFLSVSIGFLNLLPIPVLDGGHLVFQAIEALRGRPLSERAQEIGFRIGFALVIMLMVFAAYNDIRRIV